MEKEECLKDVLIRLYQKKKLKNKEPEYYMLSEYSADCMEEDELDEEEELPLQMFVGDLKKFELVVIL